MYKNVAISKKKSRRMKIIMESKLSALRNGKIEIMRLRKL